MRYGGFIEPEPLSDLWLECTAQATQPHFDLDPGWPPPADHYVAQRAPDWKPKVKPTPRPFPKGHVFSVACPLCSARAGHCCRSGLGIVTMAHWVRYFLAWGSPPTVETRRDIEQDANLYAKELRYRAQKPHTARKLTTYSPRIFFFEEEDIPMMAQPTEPPEPSQYGGKLPEPGRLELLRKLGCML